MSKYLELKAELKRFSKSITEDCKGDKPKYRMLLNDFTNSLIINNKLSEYKQSLLHLFCGKLHNNNKI